MELMFGMSQHFNGHALERTAEAASTGEIYEALDGRCPTQCDGFALMFASDSDSESATIQSETEYSTCPLC